MLSKHNILFLRGLKDDGTVNIVKITNNTHLLYNTEGSCNVFDNLNTERFNKQLITLDANQQQDIQYADTHLIFNQIANADTHKVTLSKASKLCNTIGNHVPCINPPSKIIRLTRDSLGKLLSGISNIIVPQTVRFSPTTAKQINNKMAELDWSYPVIIRQCGDHNGKNMIKLNNIADSKKLAYTFFRNECYLSQFINYADNKGIHRKLRLVVVNGQLFIRHVLYSDHWKVATGARDYMKANSWHYDYEKQLMETFNTEIKPHIIDTILKIHQAIELDYFGIDCALSEENKLLIFEINPNMNILHNNATLPNLWATTIGDIKKQITEMIVSKL